jgi:hypothetical protein
MGQITFAPAEVQSYEEQRRAVRIRKVLPVAFASPGGAGDTFRRTVTANVSRGGMLLVSRKDRFPPAGSALTIMPFNAVANEGAIAPAAIPGRVVYTRFSPRTDLRFAGLKFEIELGDEAARSIGLDGAPDAVARTLQALERVEALAEELAVEALATPPTAESIARESIAVRRKMDEACTEFFHATESFLRIWGEKRLRDTVARRHALSLAKGAAGIRALKDEWRSLEQGIPALVDAQLNRDSLWPHRSADAANPDTASGEVWFYDLERDRPPARIMEELRKLAGFIGRIIIRHGFEDISDGGEWSAIAHERALVSFTGPFTISDAMRAPLVCAAALEDEYRQLVKRTAEAGTQAMRTKALDLWEYA